MRSFIPIFLTAALLSAHEAGAVVALDSAFGANMVLQREKPLPVRGTATPASAITVTFNGQTKSATADSGGKWRATLDPMSAKTAGGNFTVSQGGANTITLGNVVVGDVWICSGQSNMDMALANCNRKAQDQDTANYPVMRSFRAPLVSADEPEKTVTGTWQVCTPATSGQFSAVAFYFGREICDTLNSSVPVGLYVASVGGTTIDLWLAPEGLTDEPVLAPLYNQSVLPSGPFSFFNGMVYPYSPLPAKGMIWYQGENAERTVQSPDSYYLKMKALAQGYKRMTGSADFPFYFVQIAYWGQQQTSPAPVLDPNGGWSADTRLQQANAMAIPHSGMASAMDVGSSLDGDQIWDGWHPKTKQDVGERLALWALKNEYAQPIGETSGPILRDITVNAGTLVCTFDHYGSGLMVGSKTPYQPTTEVVGGALDKFSIAGTNGTWYDATASIVGNTVVLSSPSVPSPIKAAYACWQNPVGANLYNRDGLPASPFYMDNVNAKFTVTASAGVGGTISHPGAESYLKRMTSLYQITPNAGYQVQDVNVDGVSVGAATSHTFDPIAANHTISATFSTTAPDFTISAPAATGGSLAPSGNIAVTAGQDREFNVSGPPNAIVRLTVDGKSLGRRDRYVFADVRKDHSISATFSFPIDAQSGYGGSISPPGATVANYGDSIPYQIAPNAGFATSKVLVDGVSVEIVANYTFSNVTAAHTISATFSGTGGGGGIPQTGKIYASFLTDNLPASGTVTSWASYLPTGKTLSAQGTPTVETIDGRKFVKNINVDGDGLDMGEVSSPIPATGATIITVAKPARFGADPGWDSIVDLFYDRLVLGIMNGSGKVIVRRNGSLDTSTATIPDGQTTILSLVVQQDGKYKVYSNGVQVMNVTGTSDMSSIVPGVAGAFAKHINLGRNAPDAWSTYNGQIGDTFIYTTALPDAERQQLETYLVNRLTASGTSYTINATAGAGGTIGPSGAVLVAEGGNQTFTISPGPGYAISAVTVDGAGIGTPATHTFSGVSGNHTISATFVPTGNTPPTCLIVPDQTLAPNSSTAALSFTIGDAATPAGNLTVSAQSSNPALVPAAGIILGGTGANRTVKITPSANATGSATVTLTVGDGELSTTSAFTVTVVEAGGGAGIGFNVGLNGEISASAEAGAVPLADWNDLTGGNNPSLASVKDSSGTVVPGMTVAFQGNGNTFNSNGAASQNLVSGFLTGDPMTATLTAIPYARYDVYVYYAGFNNNNSYIMSWSAKNPSDNAVLGELHSVRGTLGGPQLFPNPGLKESSYASLADAQAQATAGNGGNWLRFAGLTAANLKISETGSGFFNENGFSGLQIVNTTPPTPRNEYASWISAYPGVGAATGLLDDADGDGIPNGVENFLGTDPAKFSEGLKPVSITNSIFRFRHSRSNSPASDLIAAYRWSADLVHWQASGETDASGVKAGISSEVVNDLNAPENDLVEVAVKVFQGAADRVFARIECSKTF